MPHFRRHLQAGSLQLSLVGQLQLTPSRQPILLMWHTCHAVLAPAAVKVLGCCDPCSPKHNATIIDADLRDMIANRHFVLFFTAAVAGQSEWSDLGAAAHHECNFLDQSVHRRDGFRHTSNGCLHCLRTNCMFWSRPAGVQLPARKPAGKSVALLSCQGHPSEAQCNNMVHAWKYRLCQSSIKA